MQYIIVLMRFIRDKFIIVNILKYINVNFYIALKAIATKIKKKKQEKPKQNLETLEEKYMSLL